ncbi:PH domain-containing protein [Halomarina ordinaria]|uniref:PH domain-containing protein n=1 Tax=Halomarina ordinaria TaxID=3033939 RepID=A0ABD5U3Q2_9EURY|nr:PH domain-containing protein [Halomarina sp. PSRA2]
MERDAPSGAADAADAGSFDWLTLDEGEEVLWSGKPHVYSIVPALVVGIPLSLVLVGIPIVVGAYLNRENTVYLLTSEGLYRKQGILSRDVRKIGFEKVQNTSFTQGPLGTYVGYGNVDISTAGGAGVEMRFQSVPDPKSVQERINRQIRRARPGGRSEEADDERPEDVLGDILDELRAIRTLVEGEGERENEGLVPGDEPDATDGHGDAALDATDDSGTDGSSTDGDRADEPRRTRTGRRLPENEFESTRTRSRTTEDRDERTDRE